VKFSVSSLRVRLLLLVLIAVIPALGLIYYNALRHREEAAHDAQQESLRLVQRLSAEHQQLIDSGHQLMMAVAKLPQILDYNSEGCSKLFSDLIGKFKEFTAVAAAKPNGAVFCSSTPEIKNVNFFDRPYFQRVVKSRKFTVSEFVIGRFSGKPIITLAYPALNDQGEIRAVLVIGLDLSWFDRIVSGSQLSPGSNVTVIDSNGVILSRLPDPEKLTGKRAPEATIVKTVLAKHEGTTEAVDLDGVSRLYAFTSLGIPGAAAVYVWAGIPEKEAYEKVNRILADNLKSLGVVIFLVALLTWTGSEIFLLRKIRALVDATKRLSAGDLGTRLLEPFDTGELGQLARSFDAMADSLQRRYRELKALHEIESAVTSSLDLRSVIAVLLDKIDDYFPYAVTTVRLLNKKTGELESFACRNVDEDEWKKATVASTGGLTRMLPENNAPVVIHDAQTDPRSLSPEFLRSYGLVSLLRVPLAVKDEVVGVLSFFTKEEYEFTVDEVNFLTTLAGQAAISIYNSQLYEEIRTAKENLETVNQRLERSLKELSGLYTALTPLAPSESVHDMMEGIIERLQQATGADAALIWLYNADDEAFHCVCQRGFDDYFASPHGVPRVGSALDRVYRSGEAIIVPDIATEPRLQKKVQLKLGFRSCAMLPLLVRDQVHGIIHLTSRQLDYFDFSRKDHLTAIARQMGIALENRALFNSLKTSRDALEKANKVKNEFLNVMSHELRTPLNVVMGYTEIVKGGVYGELNSKQMEALNKVTARSRDLLDMINDVLYVTSIEARAVKLETTGVDLEQFLKSLRSDYDFALKAKVSLSWDYPSHLPVVKTDAEKLRHILQNLIGNAIKFTPAGRITITAHYFSEDGILEFAVSDTGIGIAEDVLPFIFEKFRQGDSSETRTYGGAGVGLYIVKKFTEFLGGEIEVKSETGKGSKFIVRLPVETADDAPINRERLN